MSYYTTQQVNSIFNLDNSQLKIWIKRGRLDEPMKVGNNYMWSSKNLTQIAELIGITPPLSHKAQPVTEELTIKVLKEEAKFLRDFAEENKLNLQDTLFFFLSKGMEYTILRKTDKSNLKIPEYDGFVLEIGNNNGLE